MESGWGLAARARTETMDDEAEKERDKKKMATSPQAKSGSGSSGSSNDMQIVNAKLTLWCAQQVRSLTGSVWDFMMADAGHAAAIAAKEMGKQYDEQVKEKGRNHGLGSPHVHTAVAFMKALDEMAGKQKAALHAFAALAPAMTKEQVNDAMPYFRVQVIKNGDQKGKHKISMLFNPLALPPTGNQEFLQKVATAVAKVSNAGQKEDIEKAVRTGYDMPNLRSDVLTVLLETNCVQGEGAPPRGDLERSLQRMLGSAQSK